MLREFLITVYLMVTTGHWKELADYIRLIGEISSQPVLEIKAGKPRDKPL